MGEEKDYRLEGQYMYIRGACVHVQDLATVLQLVYTGQCGEKKRGLVRRCSPSSTAGGTSPSAAINSSFYRSKIYHTSVNVSLLSTVSPTGIYL